MQSLLKGKEDVEFSWGTERHRDVEHSVDPSLSRLGHMADWLLNMVHWKKEALQLPTLSVGIATIVDNGIHPKCHIQSIFRGWSLTQRN